MKRWMIVLLIVVVVLAGGFLTVAYFVRSTSTWARTLTWPEPNLTDVADGVYEGTVSLKMPPGTAAANTTATVRVTVRNHRYEAVEVTAPPPIATGMTRFAQIIVDEQTLRPDAISGGTITKSLVLMAAAKAVGSQ